MTFDYYRPHMLGALGALLVCVFTYIVYASLGMGAFLVACIVYGCIGYWGFLAGKKAVSEQKDLSDDSHAENIRLRQLLEEAQNAVKAEREVAEAMTKTFTPEDITGE